MQPPAGNSEDVLNEQGPRAAGLSSSPRDQPTIYGNQSELAIAEAPGTEGSSSGKDPLASSTKQPKNSVFAEIIASLDDPIELAALVKLQACDQIEPGKFTVEQVLDTIAWALEADVTAATLDTDQAAMRSEFLRRMQPKAKMTRRQAYHAACKVVTILLLCFCVYFALSLAVHVLTQEVSADQNGVLFGSRDGGESRVVTTGSAVVLRSLMSYPSLSASELRRVKDAVFVHMGTWHCVRIARTVKYSNHHVVLHSHDGSAVRVREGKVYFQNKYGPWEMIDITESEKYSSRLDEYEARWLLHGAFATDTVAAPLGYSLPW